MSDFQNTAVLGAGVIGASWTALFLASGKSVSIYDPSSDAKTTVKQYIENSWPILEQLELTENGNPDNLSFHKNPADAVSNASFIQESAPERLDIKHALYQQIESALNKDAVIASSASGLTLSEMQAGFNNPQPLVLGHPFNPPHLIPLVEVMGNDATGGPTLLFHLGAGDGGLQEFCERYTPSFNQWWDDLGELHLDPTIAQQLVSGVQEETGNLPAAELSAKRDEMLAAILAVTSKMR